MGNTFASTVYPIVLIYTILHVTKLLFHTCILWLFLWKRTQPSSGRYPHFFQVPDCISNSLFEKLQRVLELAWKQVFLPAFDENQRTSTSASIFTLHRTMYEIFTSQEIDVFHNRPEQQRPVGESAHHNLAEMACNPCDCWILGTCLGQWCVEGFCKPERWLSMNE